MRNKGGWSWYSEIVRGKNARRWDPVLKKFKCEGCVWMAKILEENYNDMCRDSVGPNDDLIFFTRVFLSAFRERYIA
tara:strand:+ start:118081 stop:118311 length:231 start_codon:yes stop_codon:yes gene_type:complete